jgi:hypothetical protein
MNIQPCMLNSVSNLHSQNCSIQGYFVTNLEEARAVADKFIADHHLSAYTDVHLDSVGNITICWEHQLYRFVGVGTSIKIEVLANRADLILRPGLLPLMVTFGNENRPYLPGIEFQWTYPTGPIQKDIYPS